MEDGGRRDGAPFGRGPRTSWQDQAGDMLSGRVRSASACRRRMMRAPQYPVKSCRNAAKSGILPTRRDVAEKSFCYRRLGATEEVSSGLSGKQIDADPWQFPIGPDGIVSARGLHRVRNGCGIGNVQGGAVAVFAVRVGNRTDSFPRPLVGPRPAGTALVMVPITGIGTYTTARQIRTTSLAGLRTYNIRLIARGMT